MAIFDRVHILTSRKIDNALRGLGYRAAPFLSGDDGIRTAQEGGGVYGRVHVMGELSFVAGLLFFCCCLLRCGDFFPLISWGLQGMGV